MLTEEVAGFSSYLNKEIEDNSDDSEEIEDNSDDSEEIKDNSDDSEEFEDNSDDFEESQSLENNNQNDNNSIELNITDEVARGLRLLEVKARRNITDAAFKEIVAAASGTSISLYKLTKTIKSIVSLKPIWVDMCINSCCAFTGNFKTFNSFLYTSPVLY